MEMAASHLHQERAPGGLESVCTSLGLLRTIRLKPAGQQEEAMEWRSESAAQCSATLTAAGKPQMEKERLPQKPSENLQQYTVSARA